MAIGEQLTRVTIWLALAGYGLGAGTLLRVRKRESQLAFARAVWTLGCLSYLAHVVFAFHYYHAWSHQAAYRETARQTRQVVNLEFGSGVFVSYAFTLGWLADVVWWWCRGVQSYWRRPSWLTLGWHGFFLFVVFNATVVFESGAVRWIGFALCLGLAAVWWSGRSVPAANDSATQ